MEIIGSKNGEISRIGDSKLIKKNGVNMNLANEASKSELIREMERLSKGPSQEEIENEILKRQQREVRIQDEYKKWLETDHVSEYKNHSPVNPNHSIVKVFYYNEIPKTDLLILDNVEGYHRVYPIAKVVAVSEVGDRIFKPGDIVSIPSVMCKTIQSEEWVKYQRMVREQPTLKHEVPEPAAYVGKLNEWIPYMYSKNPFTDTNIDDQHTFCLRDSLLQAKVIV
jgi:histone deacetylase complex regulatory component SIN3